MKFKPSDLNLYLVTDRSWLGEQSLEQVVEAVLQSGVTFLQYREKDMGYEENRRLAEALKPLARQHNIPYVINDDIELALAIDADGVHVGQSDLEASQARDRIGMDKILGVSVRTVEEALKAQTAGADYLGVGAMFPTETKQDATDVSMDVLKAICSAVHIPVVAIGGIHHENVLKLKDTGVEGAAVISAILAKENPSEATKTLKHLTAQLNINNLPTNVVRQHRPPFTSSRSLGPDRSSLDGGLTVAKVLTIAGSDCSGGAGIQADLKTMMAHGVYGMSVITALTAQNTTGVYGVQEASPEFVGQQLDCIFKDITPDAVKIGMVSSIEIIQVIADKLVEYGARNIVIDPVMFSTSGHALMSENAMATLVEALLPLGTIITPNLSEAEQLWGRTISTKEDMIAAGTAIGKTLKGAILVKGGHLDGRADDLLVSGTSQHWFEGERIENPNTHGTGCTLSSAIACHLALGLPLHEAVAASKGYITKALKAQLDLGQGRGPLNHCV